MKGLENAIRNLNSLDTRMVPQASAWAINRVAQKAVSVATRQVAGNTVAGDKWSISVMETFHWKVRPDMNVVSEPKVVTVKLGDGYEQRRAAGLNNQLSTYSVTIRVRKCEHPSLKAFLERHGGVRAFQWTPPYDWKPIRVVCRKWSASVGALWVTITADFEQVVA